MEGVSWSCPANVERQQPNETQPGHALQGEYTWTHPGMQRDLMEGDSQMQDDIERNSTKALRIVALWGTWTPSGMQKDLMEGAPGGTSRSFISATPGGRLRRNQGWRCIAVMLMRCSGRATSIAASSERASGLAATCAGNSYSSRRMR